MSKDSKWLAETFNVWNGRLGTAAQTAIAEHVGIGALAEFAYAVIDRARKEAPAGIVGTMRDILTREYVGIVDRAQATTESGPPSLASAAQRFASSDTVVRVRHHGEGKPAEVSEIPAPKVGGPTPRRVLVIEPGMPATGCAGYVVSAPSGSPDAVVVAIDRGPDGQERHETWTLRPHQVVDEPELPPGCRLTYDPGPVPDSYGATYNWRVIGRNGTEARSTAPDGAAERAWRKFSTFLTRQDWERLRDAERELGDCQAGQAYGREVLEREIEHLRGALTLAEKVVSDLTRERDSAKADRSDLDQRLMESEAARARAERSEQRTRERLAALGDQYNAERAKRQDLERERDRLATLCDQVNEALGRAKAPAAESMVGRIDALAAERDRARTEGLIGAARVTIDGRRFILKVTPEA